MKKIKILGIVLSSIFIVYTSALADKGVFNAGITPNETFINTPTIVKITAEVGSENLYISSVMAYQVDENGRPIARLGQMYDDGTHGDETEADTIFTLEIEMNQAEASKFYYVVTAAYYRDRNRYMSPAMEFTVRIHLPDGIVENAVVDLSGLKQEFIDLLSSMSVEEARQVVYSSAANDPQNSEVVLDGPFLSYLYMGRVECLAILEDPLNPVDAMGNSFPNNLPAIYKSPGNDKVLLFAPGYTDGQDAIVDHAETRFGNAEYMKFDPDPPSAIKDSAASLEVVKNWGDYGTVIIHTHGGNISGQIVLLSGTEATTANQESYEADIDEKRIGIYDGKFYFKPSFIAQHAKSMKNTFFYLGACHSLENDTMWDALRAKGAKIGFGWTDTVCRTFNSEKFEELIDPMLPTDDSTDPETAKQAFDNITVKTDDSDVSCDNDATLVMRTASTEWENFLFVDGGIVNGDFETGDWTGWTTGGDYNFRIISGARKHDGNNSAALGRWDTAYHGYDDTAEPYGYEWMYQDFTVPNNVTTLKFYWWMETYDTAVWDWFDAYIKDTNGNTLKTILSKAGKPGTNYGPYWSTQMADGGTGWREVTVDISAYQGQEIRIYFDQRLDGYGDQQRVYIDDVTLE